MIRLIYTVAALALALGLAGKCSAQAVIGLHVGSAHERGGYNNANPGVYVRSESGWTVGGYLNSYKRGSAYVGKAWSTDRWHGLSAAIAVGGITGYPQNTVMPFAAPSVAWHAAGGTGARLAIIPRPNAKGSGVIHLMIETNWSK